MVAPARLMLVTLDAPDAGVLGSLEGAAWPTCWTARSPLRHGSTTDAQ